MPSIETYCSPSQVLPSPLLRRSAIFWSTWLESSWTRRQSSRLRFYNFIFSRKSWQTFSTLPLFQEILEKHFLRFYFFQKCSHPFHPLLGRGGPGQGDGVYQEPEGIQDLLPGVWDMIGNSWMQILHCRIQMHLPHLNVKPTWHLFAQFIEGYLIHSINRSTR